MVFVAITRVTVHFVNTIAGSTRIKPTIINDLTQLFLVFTTSIWKSEMDSRNLCAHRQAHLPLDQGTVLVESPLFSIVLIVGPWRCIATGTSTILSLGNDLGPLPTISFTTLKYGGRRLSAPRCAAECAPVGSVAQLQQSPQ